MTPVEKARQQALENAPKAMASIVGLLDDPPRNAMAIIQAAKVILEVSGVTAAISAEHAMEVLMVGLRARMTTPAYQELTRAFAGIRGMVTETETVQ